MVACLRARGRRVLLGHVGHWCHPWVGSAARRKIELASVDLGPETREPSRRPIWPSIVVRIRVMVSGGKGINFRGMAGRRRVVPARATRSAMGGGPVLVAGQSEEERRPNGRSEASGGDKVGN